MLSAQALIQQWQPYAPERLGQDGFAWPQGQFRILSPPRGRWAHWRLRRRRLRIRQAAGGRGNCVVLPAQQAQWPELDVYFGGSGSTIWIDGQSHRHAGLRGLIECHGDAGLVVLGRRDHHLSDLTIRLFGHRQTAFWGAGSTANGTHLIVSGDEQSIIVGEDCMFSVNTWVRNSDQHALIDPASGRQLNAPLGSVLIGPRVWLGQDSLVLGAQTLGKGCVVGAKTLVNRSVAPGSLVAGVPARQIRESVSWDRRLLIYPPAQQV